MTKPNKLREAMLNVQGRVEPPPAPVPEQEPAVKPRIVQTRLGKRAVTGFVSPEAYRQLHYIALDKDCSIQNLVVEAFNDLFRKYNKSAIA